MQPTIFAEGFEVAIKFGFVTAAEFDALVKPEDMTHP